MTKGYTVEIFVYQTNPGTWFKCVEKGSWYYADGTTWSETDGVHKLTMNASGTSGMLRFMNRECNEAFFVVAGIHNWKPWLDVGADLADDMTVVKTMSDYYSVGNNPLRRQASSQDVSVTNSKGRKTTAKYTVTEGNNLTLHIIIG